MEPDKMGAPPKKSGHITDHGTVTATARSLYAPAFQYIQDVFHDKSAKTGHRLDAAFKIIQIAWRHDPYPPPANNPPQSND